MPIVMHRYYLREMYLKKRLVESAEYHEGSWWRYWHQWLYRKSGAKVPARIPGDGGLDVIEDAPGSYVKMN